MYMFEDFKLWEIPNGEVVQYHSTNFGDEVDNEHIHSVFKSIFNTLSNLKVKLESELKSNTITIEDARIQMDSIFSLIYGYRADVLTVLKSATLKRNIDLYITILNCVEGLIGFMYEVDRLIGDVIVEVR